jgi:radical SAM protein with 4Fe4S-binding SPASM domain
MCYKGKQEIKCLEKSYLEATSRGFKIFCRSLEAGPCIAIARGGLVIEPNGNISKCHHLAGNPKYILGNINKGVSLQVLDEVLPSAWKGCVQCECVPLCLGGCRYEAVRYVNRVDAKICGVKSYFKEIIPAYLSQVIKSEAPDERKQDSIFIR